MLIESGDNLQFIESRYVKRIRVIVENDAALVQAIMVGGGEDKTMVTIGRYANKAEATSALYSLIIAISEAEEEGMYTLPPSRLQEQPKVHDARIKRRGGS